MDDLVNRKEELDQGAFIGHEPEFAAETIPGGVQPADERVSANSTQSSGEGSPEHRVEGRPDEWPEGHRHNSPARGDDDTIRGSGQRG